MITTKLIAHTNVPPEQLASHAAKICYSADTPVLGDMLNVRGQLFETGHHTTLEHFSMTFAIDGIAVGDITLGLHLPFPFYNSDQRSGRYCAKMFLEPDYAKIEAYISAYWPDLSDMKRQMAMDYVRRAVTAYHENIGQATAVAMRFIAEERSFASEKMSEQNAPKFAQEQMRMFIPVIFPTAFDYTIDLITLVSLYYAAWTPVLRDVADQMVKELLAKFPEINYMFDPAKRPRNDWSPIDPSTLSPSLADVVTKPRLSLLEVMDIEKFKRPSRDIMSPVDLLHFLPGMMDNSVGLAKTSVEISLATMGQDQRHRTIHRSMPEFTGDFYLPPILAEMRLDDKARDIMSHWLNLSKVLPPTLAAVLAPYGAVVRYTKAATFNALAHEMAKRLCWCAQEEIYHLGRELRMEMLARAGLNPEIVHLFEPPCFEGGKCLEGARFCGRDLRLREEGDFFPERKV